MPQSATGAERAERNANIVADRARGMSWDKIADKYGMARFSVQRIWKEHADAKLPELAEREALEVIFGVLERYEHWQSDLAEVAEGAKGTSKVGAIRAQMDCEARKTELMQATGLLPKHLGKVAVEYDIRFVVQRLAEAFDRHEIPVPVQREILGLLQHKN